ncbi:COG2426 family protein [Chloroflexota bacterium]
MFLEELLSLDLSNVLAVLAIAASPVSELRGAIPIAIVGFHFPWYYAFLLAIIGNLLPVPLLLLFFDILSRLLIKIGIPERMFHWLLERTRRRGKLIERYERIGLMLFVAIPLPITGAWTGSLAAVLFGIKFKHAFLSIFIGILIAGSIVTCLSLLGWTGAIIAGLGLIGLAVFSLWRA